MSRIDGPLSEREEDILPLVADGWSNQEIADILTISERTIRTHVSHIITKLKARNRTDAVRIARQAGMLEGEYQPSYGHRNGESEPPRVPGGYWTEIPATSERDFVQVAAAPWGEWRMRRFQGDWEAYGPERLRALGVCWWGPVLSPWDNKP